MLQKKVKHCTGRIQTHNERAEHFAATSSEDTFMYDPKTYQTFLH